jgi:hypothetical protein
LGWQHGFQSPGLNDRVAALEPLDCARHQVFLASEEVAEDLLALGIADLLQDDLLGRLRPDAPEVDRLEGLFDVVADLDVGLLFPGLGQQVLLVHDHFLDLVGHDKPTAEGAVVASLAVDRDAHVYVFLEALLGGRGEGHLECGEHDFALDILLARQRIDHQQDVATHLLPSTTA